MSATVSIVVNTLNRADSLKKLLEGLKQLDYPEFEVVVVNGPSTDGTGDLLDRWAGAVRRIDCPERNISVSRNLGIAHAAGELVAFIDDDAYPDPKWLARLEKAFDDPEVAAAGGPVFDHTGFDIQAWYQLANTLGDTRKLRRGVNPTSYFNFPASAEHLLTLGTNAIFRRGRLVEIGGFDEEFDYYMDEVDVCRRLLLQGHVIAAVDDAFVYHKFLRSDVRSENRAIRKRLPVIKNKVYYGLKHGLRHHSYDEVMANAAAFVEASRGDFRWCVANGLLTAEDLAQFDTDAPAAFDMAIAAHRAGIEKVRPAGWFDRAELMLPFPARRPRGRRLHLCFLSQEYPPGPVNGIGRVIHALATGLAAEGHTVRVLTRGGGRSLVDLEEGVWVHRVAVDEQPLAEGLPAVPRHLWNYSASMLKELERIDGILPIDIVEGPNWDSELVAILAGGRFRTVLGLYTPLALAREINPEVLGDSAVLDSMVELERFCAARAHAVRASGPGVLEAAGLAEADLPPGGVGYIHHGLADLARPLAPAHPHDEVNVLFVGRLEKRKGVDMLLQCIPDLLQEVPGLAFTLAGDDSLPGEGGRSYRQEFEMGAGSTLPPAAVRFTGRIDDPELNRLYAACDIFVAPSRFESFGLILVEAMMHGKPVIAGDNPGMRLVVEEGGNGTFVAPDDVQGLHDAVAALARSPELREAFGVRSRALYEERFTVGRMVGDCELFYSRLVDS